MWQDQQSLVLNQARVVKVVSICVIGSSICDLGLAFPFSSSNESLTFCCDPLLGGLTGVVTPPLDPLLPRVVGREDLSQGGSI
jgi:hypothetical protein